jgi:hypothetical protein
MTTDQENTENVVDNQQKELEEKMKALLKENPKPHRSITNVKIIFIRMFPDFKEKWLPASLLAIQKGLNPKGKIDNPENKEKAQKALDVMPQEEQDELIEKYTLAKAEFDKEDKAAQELLAIWEEKFTDLSDFTKLTRQRKREETARKKKAEKANLALVKSGANAPENLSLFMRQMYELQKCLNDSNAKIIQDFMQQVVAA